MQHRAEPALKGEPDYILRMSGCLSNSSFMAYMRRLPERLMIGQAQGHEGGVGHGHAQTKPSGGSWLPAERVVSAPSHGYYGARKQRD